MKVRLVFVPPGGGEADYSLDFDLPGIPQPGDYISITRPQPEGATEFQGTSDFIVRRTWWHLKYPNNALYREGTDRTLGSVSDVVVECEFALGPYSGDDHKQSCEGYRVSGKGKGQLQEFEATAY